MYFYCIILLLLFSAEVPEAKTVQTLAGTYGVDVSSLVSISDFSCLKTNNYSFAIVRAYRSTCEPDYNAVHTVANAHAAGIQYVDVYLFPSPTCSKSASDQVKEMVNEMGSIPYGQIWLDIEGPQYWLGSKTANQKFFEELLSAASVSSMYPFCIYQYKNVGIYSSYSQWDEIMSLNYTGGSSHQLWYAHYETPPNPSFSDFEPFGGWSHPTMKQYVGNAIVCGVNVDKNWY